MDSKLKAKPFTRRAVIISALEPSLLPPLINLVCDFVPFGTLGAAHCPRGEPLLCSVLLTSLVEPSTHALHRVLCCAVDLALEYRQLCKDTGNWPLRMVHSERYLFIGDYQSDSILVYSLERNWTFVRAIGSKGDGRFAGPMGMCVFRDRLIVCDRYNHRLQFIDISAADAAHWRFDPPVGLKGTAKGQFRFPADVCEAGGVLFVAEQNRVQTLTIAVDVVTRALSLIPRSVGLYHSCSLACSSDSCRVFVADNAQLSRIDYGCGGAPFLDIAIADAMCFADGLLYAVHDGGRLSVIHAESGVIQHSAAKTVHGQSWSNATGIAVLPDFICIADPNSHCVHVIPRS
jgi:hypothetical protein